MHDGRILAFVLAIALAAPPLPAAALWQVCGGGSYTTNRTYEANLVQVASTLPINASSSPLLFATTTVGAVHALALCRGDVNADSCLSCLTSAFQDAQTLCASDMDVTMYYDTCHVRFSNQDFLASKNNSQQKLIIFSTTPTLSSSVAERFHRLVAELLNATTDYAVANSTRRFATGQIDVNADYFDGQFSKIYASAQCTPDLTPAQCRSCLASAMADMTQRVFPQNSPGARVLGERCGLRFEVFAFYNIDAMVRLQLQIGPRGKRKQTPILAIVIPIIFCGLLAMTLISFCIWRKKRLPRKAPLLANTEDLENFESFFIDLSTLRSATANFDESNKLGEGGFGAVYKGVLPDAQEVAVKRLSQCSKQGLGQLKNEIALVAKLQHKNLVRLVGFCLEEGEKMLVYEYMPNKSLDTILFDPDKSKQLDWGKRYRILNGIARGLQYLHEHSQLKIVHRDLKASNVLLDADMKPKISDFGLAKIFGDDQTRNATSRIVGTLGYMPPEYAMRGQYSTKLDVFSFGVLVLEIVTGRRNSFAVSSEHSEDIFSLMWKHWKEGKIAEIVDPSLGRHFPRGEVLKCVNIGLLCVQQNPTDRPSMSAIIIMLSSDTVSLQAPYRPAYLFGRSSSYSEAAYVKEQHSSEPQSSITELEPR